ncbi:ABC transporter permease DevC [Pararhizobium sp. IMCC21322]|uniref:ABC transporter permease DevC n=1 Tax=Pararhizobium sp. IMCC21322 TaxID=3067903 RepID=UPI0027410989|nr:ABC transporter permease DevC [Pararhizobium sp. IMCC21322]
MTAILARLLGRMPIGWLQLLHNKTRLAAAVAGIAFANILVFVQLGVMFALNTTILLPYTLFDADIIISSADANTLTDGSNVPRQRGFESMSVPGVASALPLFIGNVDWTRDDGNVTNLQVLALDPSQGAYVIPEIRNKIANLLLIDTALIDRLTRGADTDRLSLISPDNPLIFETRGRTLKVPGTISIGGGFSSDGYMVTSDQTFLRLFSSRIAGAPNHILLKTKPGFNVDAVIDELRLLLPDNKVKVRTLADAAKADQIYQTTERPTGLIFGFGVVMGVIVGLVIVYQLLSTDVADHLKEYATFKAMGYGQSFFMGIIFEEALILAIFGFVPGLIISSILYQLLNSATGLPVMMDMARPIAVFLGTIASCSISGAIATRRLASADPADLF